MLGVSGLLKDGCSLPVDSAGVDVLQTGQWSPGDPPGCLHHSLQAVVLLHQAG